MYEYPSPWLIALLLLGGIPYVVTCILVVMRRGLIWRVGTTQRKRYCTVIANLVFSVSIIAIACVVYGWNEIVWDIYVCTEETRPLGYLLSATFYFNLAVPLASVYLLYRTKRMALPRSAVDDAINRAFVPADNGQFHLSDDTWALLAKKK